MKISNLLKELMLLVAFLSCNIGINAQCDITDDLATMVGEDEYWFYNQTSTNGWEGTNVRSYNYDGIHYTGIKYANGVLKSTVFPDGCKSLSFQWQWEGFGSSGMLNNGVRPLLKVELKKGETTVWSDTLTFVSNLEEYVPVQASYSNLNITGEVQLVLTEITNATPDQYDAGFEVWDFCIANYIIPTHNFQFNVPKDATVFVGDKDQTVTVAGNYLTKHYIPFTKKDEVFTAETDSSRIWYYNLPSPKNSSGGFNYRVTRTGKAPHVGLFKPKTGTTVEADTLLRFTDAQLSLYDAKASDHNVNNLAGRNVADVFLNINAQGFLTLPLKTDTTFQIVNCRNWQAIDTDVNNYFIDPNFHYTVLNENGVEDNSIIEISDSGKIAPKAKGIAIVLVSYDAMICHHTTNVGISDVKANGAFFSAIWPENTGVFVVAVDEPESGIKSNMLINQYWSSINGTDKVDSTQVDAEQDVLYYEANKGSFPFTFKPDGVSQVLMATPAVGENSLSYSGFSADSVTVEENGNYTAHLSFGRNIIKMIGTDGSFKYQVITAKPVSWTVSGGTGENDTFMPGDKVSVLFNTLYHPCNKLSGIYNMSAGIQYTGADVNFPLILGPGQYTFASKAQTYTVTIPTDYTENEYVLTNGVIKVKGFGSYYGQHRNITLQSGVAPNLNASVRTGYFGSVPDIHIPMHNPETGINIISNNTINVFPNPFSDYLIVNSDKTQVLKLFSISGQCLINTQVTEGTNRLEVKSLPKGTYVLQSGNERVKLVK